jgi:hypothetical protein
MLKTYLLLFMRLSYDGIRSRFPSTFRFARGVAGVDPVSRLQSVCCGNHQLAVCVYVA